jgi:hypothetical protein
MRLYPKNEAKELDPSLFRNPTAEYRGAPFWGWNCRLDSSVLEGQIESLHQMGFGGFHIHARVGLDTPYLGDEFMNCVKESDRIAAQKGMLCWLYDEDRFPSGFAGGLVTKDVRFRARTLLLTQAEGVEYEVSREEFDRRVENGEKPAGYYLASYRVELKDGRLAAYRRTERDDGDAPGAKWNVFVVLSTEDPYYNNQTYVDVLNPAAIRCFLEITYERYYEVVGSEFGKSIPAIFTDEPQLSRKWTLPTADSGADVSIPFTDDFPDTYRAQYGEDLLDRLPELFWELPEGKASQTRYRFHDHMAERFAEAYMDSIAAWCGAHNLYATGHFMSERTLFSQTIRLGDCMRMYRRYQLPGIDILCDDKEFSTAKQAVSVARQYGREGVASELYGVTNWYQDFKGHKLQGDWQAALGITVRVPHLAWMTMAGEGKRDWPACIGFQSPWYREYPYLEDHFARLNTALTRGKNVVRVAVVHPIESYWLMFGPEDQTGDARADYDAQFEALISWLLFGTIDFDFLAESLLPELSGGDARAVGKMRYDVVVMPDCRTLRSSTLRWLKCFRSSGGRVIFAGGVPELVDAVPSEKVKAFARECETVRLERSALLAALEPERDVEIRMPNGRRSDNLFYQLREDGDEHWLFLCHVNRKLGRDDQPEQYRIRIRGEYQPTIYNTITGTTESCSARAEGGFTILDVRLFAQDSLLLKLSPGRPKSASGLPEKTPRRLLSLAEPESYSLAEPNVLLLDSAAYLFDGGVLQSPEDILRIDDQFRKRLGWPMRGERMAQPWLFPNDEPDEHTLELHFSVQSQIAVAGAKLALEQPEYTQIYVNGCRVSAAPDSFYVDPQIRTVPLPELHEGENEITLKIRFHHKSNVENCYLLGAFGVRTAGSHACLVPMPEHLLFGDVAAQRLPFYAGNIVLRCNFALKHSEQGVVLEIPHFSAPAVGVALDGKRAGLVALTPQRLRLGDLAAGPHILELMVYGNRYNTFGQLHNANKEYKWYGPMSYRTVECEWTDSWQLRPWGIFDAPILFSED